MGDPRPGTSRRPAIDLQLPRPEDAAREVRAEPVGELAEILRVPEDEVGPLARLEAPRRLLALMIPDRMRLIRGRIARWM